MSTVKNFFSKKGSKIDGTIAVGIVLGALAISGLNIASAEVAPTAPVQNSIQHVITSGEAGMNITTSGSAGSSLGE